MLIEYYLASRLGEVWLRLHPALKARIGQASTRARAQAGRRVREQRVR